MWPREDLPGRREAIASSTCINGEIKLSKCTKREESIRSQNVEMETHDVCIYHREVRERLISVSHVRRKLADRRRETSGSCTRTFQRIFGFGFMDEVIDNGH